MPTRTYTRPTTSIHPKLTDWHCRGCFKLLARYDRARVYLQNSGISSYSFCAPVTAVCRCCGRLNELRAVASS